MNIAYFFKYLWRKKWIIILPTIIAVAATWYYFRNQASAYTSTAEISTGYFDMNPLGSNPNNNNSVLFNNVIQTLKSNQVLDQVTYGLLLHDIDNRDPFRKIENHESIAQLMRQFPGGKQGLITALSNKADSSLVLNLSNDNDRIIGKIASIYGYSASALLGKTTEIQRVEGSDFIDITVTTENPGLSAYIANGICRTFLGFYQNKKEQASAVSLDSLRSLVNVRKQVLENKLKLLPNTNDFSSNNSAGMIANLQSQLTQQKNDLLKAQISLQSVNAQLAAASKQGGGLANNEDIIALRTSLDNLIAQYTNGGSQDASLADKINKVRNQLQQKLSEAGDVTTTSSVGDLMRQKTSLGVQIQVAEQTIQDLQNSLKQASASGQSAALNSSVMQGIQNEVDVARQGFTQANDLLNQALNYNIFPGNNFRQTLVASPPLYPDVSKKAKKIAFAGAGVFFALIFILLFFEFMDTSIKSPSYLKENVPLPLLANLKRISLKSPPIEGIFSANGALSDYKKGFREQVKQLRYEVESSGKKIFLITGYQQGAGKTTVVESLAGSLCLKNNRILLVDVNFHHNTLSEKYKAEPALEKLELTGDSAAGNKIIEGHTTATENEQIKILGCGSGDYTPDEVLPSNNALAALRDKNALFDFVFIDGPALSQGPDAKELLKYADAVILVFAADQPLTEEDKKFVTFLSNQQVMVLGAVLNRVSKDNLAV